MIIAGHGRVRAARKLGLREVPVMVATGWTKAQIQAYALADNKLALNAGWDEELLALEIAELQEIGFDIDLIGFSIDEIAALGSHDNDGPDRSGRGAGAAGRSGLQAGRCLAARPASAAVRRQHVGRRREEGARRRAAAPDGHRPALWRRIRSGLAQATPGLKQNKQRLGKVANDDRADWREAWALFPGSVAYVWHAGRYASTVQDSLTAVGFDVRSQIIWAKDRFALSRGHYHWQHEPCWYAVRNGPANWTGDRKQSTLWQIPAREGPGLRARHPEAGRMHEAADREQLLARPGGLRAVLRLGHDHHRRRDHRPHRAMPSS